jgi:arylsulfatase A-like enzyme
MMDGGMIRTKIMPMPATCFYQAILLLALIFFLSCRASGERRMVHLYDDLRYAEQTDQHGARSTDAFEKTQSTIQGKFYTALIQRRPGAICFHVVVPKQSVLRYRLDLVGHSNPAPEVVVESDFPHPLRREFDPSAGSWMDIDLAEFQERAVSITFRTGGGPDFPRDGSLTWIDPILEYREIPSKNLSYQLARFRERHKRDNVMIFLFDAASALHMGCYGYEKNTTSVIDSLARDGMLWSNSMTQAVSTITSTASLFTGMYPETHRMLEADNMLPEGFKTMAECFHEAGFHTALFTGNPNASPVMGYGQGFDTIWFPRPGPIFASQFVPEIASWTRRVRGGQFFGYVHFREPHHPYTPPPEFLSRFSSNPFLPLPPYEKFRAPSAQDRERIIAAYNANLAYGDAQLGRILADLKAQNLFDNTIIVVLADHGEGFWQHGVQGHGADVHAETARIPMIVHFPREKGLRGVRRKEIVGSIDWLPTFLDLFGLSVKGTRVDGRSLLPILAGSPDSRPFLLTGTAYRNAYALNTTEFRFIYYLKDRKKPGELYRQPSDLFETHNLSETYPILASYYRAALLREMERLGRSRPEISNTARKAMIDEEIRQELRALGYVN